MWLIMFSGWLMNITRCRDSLTVYQTHLTMNHEHGLWARHKHITDNNLRK